MIRVLRTPVSMEVHVSLQTKAPILVHVEAASVDQDVKMVRMAILRLLIDEDSV